ATTHSLPRIDMFSFTAAGKLFVAQNWLAELLYYAVYRSGGLPLIIFFNALLLLGAYLPIYSLCREAAGKLPICALVGLFAVLGSICNTRPQVFSFLMFALYYWVLSKYRSGSRDRLWLLPGLMVLWVNLHGAFVLGIGLIALFAAAETLRNFLNTGSL